MAKLYLVTGAAGFIGAAIAKQLIKSGNSVVTIDNLSTGFVENIPDGTEFIEGSVFDECTLSKLDNRIFDAIIHVAGQSSGEISFEKPVYDFQTNGQSTLMLLDYAVKHNCRKFIYASSMSVYGSQCSNECTESIEAKPLSFYAVGKLASENYMRIFSEQYNLACTSLRLFNTYGVGQNLNNLKQGMISIYLAMAIKERRITVKGSKDRFRDFVYIDDVVEAFMLSLKRENGYDCFNVCTGTPVKVESIIKSISELLPFSIQTEYVEGTIGDQFGIYGSNKKINQIMGWSPKLDFQTGLIRMIKWALEKESK